ncbi:hypothetical protein CTAYLR_006408 [Chrysophaeum taylorii]|uniref:Potassium channel domain-containing protein n=1 Tax=Chrysophaeum taylorii TaxID=2483200 RepID=A0AAD7XJN2_9STRA|nr:hypothetical protein CTAYLR_006408 [Chrysophaeum taylorii]
MSSDESDEWPLPGHSQSLPLEGEMECLVGGAPSPGVPNYSALERLTMSSPPLTPGRRRHRGPVRASARFFKKKLAFCDEVKLVAGRLAHGCKIKTTKRQQSMDRTMRANSQRDESVSKFRPLRKTTSLLVGVEDDTTSHQHTVVQPRETLMVQMFEASTSRQTYFSALVALFSILVASTLFYTLFARWSFVDALYFSIVTLTTVGYGDVAPKDSAGRLFDLVLFFLGAGVVGSLVGSTFTAFLDEEKHKEEETLKSKREQTGGAAGGAGLQKKKNSKDPWHRLSRSLGYVGMWTVCGAITFTLFEPEVRFVDALYWAGASLTTVGYGDVHPTKKVTKVFTIFYLLGGTFIVLKALGSIAYIPIEARRRRIEAAVLCQYGDKLTQADFLELTRGDLVKRLGVIDDPTNTHNSLLEDATDAKKKRVVIVGDHQPHQSRRVTKTAFAIAMLVKLGKIEIDDVEDCFDQFSRLDHHCHGFLNFEDVDDGGDSSPERPLKPPPHKAATTAPPPPPPPPLRERASRSRAEPPKKNHRNHHHKRRCRGKEAAELRRKTLVKKDDHSSPDSNKSSSSNRTSPAAKTPVPPPPRIKTHAGVGSLPSVVDKTTPPTTSVSTPSSAKTPTSAGTTPTSVKTPTSDDYTLPTSAGTPNDDYFTLPTSSTDANNIPMRALPPDIFSSDDSF